MHKIKLVVVLVGIVVNKEIVRTVAVLLVIEFGQRKRVGHSGRISYKNVFKGGWELCAM